MSMRRMPALRILCTVTTAALIAVATSTASAQSTPPASAAGVEFFESRVRPLLAEHCYACHGDQRQRSGLRLNRFEGILQGGDRGPAVVPGKPDESPLILAVGYADDDLRMPPKSRLSDTQIADLTAWVKMGAPGPAVTTQPTTPAPQSEFVLAERRKHWAYQPVRDVAVPTVENRVWCTSPIDFFILAQLEAAGLSPAPPAERRELLRRVTFDLTGLPPAPADLAAFLSDESPNAFPRVVDRLLDSPHYGERWARHWLDLVRYCESWGFEFDFDLYNAWRYRDYVIRAFNADLPYDQFVVEHLAGDLLPEPRRNPIEGFNESILATGFFWMGEGRQTPIDIRQEQADRIDNQIDVLSKAFLAQTVACARCHDHKFDAISTQDYYSLVGYLRSSRFQQAFLDPPSRITEPASRLAALKMAAGEQILSQLAPLWLEQAAPAGRYLLAARQVMSTDTETHLSAETAAEEFDLDVARLGRWVEAMRRPEIGDVGHPLYVWAQLANAELTAEQFRQRRLQLREALREQQRQAGQFAASTVLFDDFRRADYDGWHVTGDAFGARPARAGDVILGIDPSRPVARLANRGAHSGLLSDRLQGDLRSRTFTIEKPYVHFLVAGRKARLNLIIDGYTLLMSPLYGGLAFDASSEAPRWHTMDVTIWQGHRACIELSDSTIPTHRLNPPPSMARVPDSPSEGYILLEEVRFSDDPTAPLAASGPLDIRLLDQDDPSALTDSLQDLMVDAIDRWRSGDLATDTDGDIRIALLNWLLKHGLLDGPVAGDKLASADSSVACFDARRPNSDLSDLVTRYRNEESTIPNPLRGPALVDGTGEDEYIFLRGNYQTPGEPAPRQAPVVIAGSDQPRPAAGSGRLELAKRLADPSNPLLSRVIVNRVWKHHFGEGIVRTPDDFGRMGQPPTHPELLDYLATEFVRSNWSIKELHRLMLLSSAYQMSSRPDPAQVAVDPENRRLHHMPIRRLEAEAIRDTILAVSGGLDRKLYGASVLPFLTAHMEGRGRPSSGPLDSNGRRSIYINSRRNFLTPMLLAFDYPVSFGPVGRRGVSTVPAQALTLMNDPFVVEQARRWAERVLARPDMDCNRRIESLYQDAFGRPPSDDELRAAMQFLERQADKYEAGLAAAEPWADLCHVLINVKEFIFVN